MPETHGHVDQQRDTAVKQLQSAVAGDTHNGESQQTHKHIYTDGQARRSTPMHTDAHRRTPMHSDVYRMHMHMHTDAHPCTRA